MSDSDAGGKHDPLDGPFAAGFVEEWDIAVQDLREILKTLEETDLHDSEDLAEAEEAIVHELPDAELALRDALDTVRKEARQ